MVAFRDVYQKSGAAASALLISCEPCPMAAFLSDGIDGLSSDDHQLETIILRTNLLTAVHCTSRPAIWAELQCTPSGTHERDSGADDWAGLLHRDNKLALEDGCELGHQLQAWNSSNHSPWLMIYPHFSSSMTLPPRIVNVKRKGPVFEPILGMKNIKDDSRPLVLKKMFSFGW